MLLELNVKTTLASVGVKEGRLGISLSTVKACKLRIAAVSVPLTE